MNLYRFGNTSSQAWVIAHDLAEGEATYLKSTRCKPKNVYLVYERTPDEASAMAENWPDECPPQITCIQVPSFTAVDLIDSLKGTGAPPKTDPAKWRWTA